MTTTAPSPSLRLVIISFATACLLTALACIVAAPARAAGVTVTQYAAGLNNPRGLKFGPDGNLYIAEGGTGGANPPPNDPNCVVIPPIGPYLGSPTGARISKVDAFHVVTTVVDGLPSSQTQPLPGPLVSGVGDIAFIGNTLYAVLAGAGCSHGVPEVPNGVIRVNSNGTWDMIANLSAWQRSHPVAQPEEDDFEPDGTWYSMIALRGSLYTVEPNHGDIVRVTTGGAISRVADVSATQGHVVPTVLAYHGNFYFGNLGKFPQDAGSSSIRKMTPSGQIRVDTRGFNMVLGLAFDHRDRMYVLEASAPPAPTPGTGRIIRVSPDGKKREVILDGLFFPTYMIMGPDGALYVSNFGFGPPPIGLGEVLRVQLHD